MTLPTVLRTLLDGALAVGLAPACAACVRPLESPMNGPVCGRCWDGIKPLAPPRCALCAAALLSWRTGPGDSCARCRARLSPIARSRALGEYDDPLRRILHALKYDGRRVIARTLAVKMRERCIDVLTDADAVVPVPLHWRRRWTRGFNQAADLAEGLGLPVLHALRRRRRTSSQTDLPADERHANVQDAFTLRRGITVADLCLVVVDDVRTTGATLEACARTLLEAGAGEVRALTAAVVSTRLSGEPRSRPRPSSGRL